MPANLRPSIVLLGCALLAGACRDPLPPTGNLVVSVSGLPAGVSAGIRIFGPGLQNQSITATQTLDLSPGQFILRFDTVHAAASLYAGPKFQDTIVVSRGKVESVDAAYHLASGSVAVSVTGLPSGVTATMVITGGTVARSFAAPTTITELPPGTYSIFMDTIATPLGDRYAPDAAVKQVTVTASTTPVTASATFALASATLQLNVTGLTGVIDPVVRISGPGGYTEATFATRTLRGLRGGTYTITAPNVNGACPNIFTASHAPAPLQQTRTLATTGSDEVTVAYTQEPAPPEWMNLRIDGAYLVQVTQNYAGTVPMLSGKPALLRVFGVASQCNTATPVVRVTLNDGSVHDIAASESSVRDVPAEGLLSASWNYVLPASAVQPGLTFVVEIDPDNQIVESDETDNRFPASGARTVVVRPAPTVGLRLVPVAQSVTGGLTGNVNADNLAQFMDLPKRLHPVGTYDVDLRETYTTAQPVLQSQDQNRAWSTILAEIRNLQIADSPRTDRFYYGVVEVNYQSGVAGIAYVPGKAGIGWDYLPTGSEVMAHELGHSFGRSHTPCGNPGGVDQGYPSTGLYSGGRVGSYGYDATTGTVKAADVFTDIMGYCNTKWISDYTYVGMMNWLTDPSHTSLPTTASTGDEQPALLVWGHIVDGVPVLEPAFEISARPLLPSGAGPYRITATDESGGELFSYAFEGQRIADLPYDAETFAFAIPRSALRGRALGALRLDARSRMARSVASGDVAADPGVQMARAGSRAVRLRWDASRFPVVMVRDPDSGRILSFARGGDATIVTARDEVEVNYSNRLRSSRRLVRPY